jgi:hypothetical protein
VFTALLPSNGRLFLFHCSSFLLSCHSMLLQIQLQWKYKLILTYQKLCVNYSLSDIILTFQPEITGARQTWALFLNLWRNHIFCLEL